MPQGKGRGWEEKIQHPVLQGYFDDQKVSYWHEFCIDVSMFKNRKKPGKVSVDFVVDRGNRYEVLECKDWNHPIFNVAEGFGQAMTYRALMQATGSYPDAPRDIGLGLCFVDGYGDENGVWTPMHDALIEKLSHQIGEPISIYLVCPTRAEYATEEQWWSVEKHRAVLKRGT